MTHPRFDPTINLGHLISAAVVISAIVGGWYVSDYRLTKVEQKLDALSTLVVEAARVDERMKEFSRRLDRLETR
jgi:hypothetical protein